MPAKVCKIKYNNELIPFPLSPRFPFFSPLTHTNQTPKKKSCLIEKTCLPAVGTCYGIAYGPARPLSSFAVVVSPPPPSRRPIASSGCEAAVADTQKNIFFFNPRELAPFNNEFLVLFASVIRER